MDTDSQAANDGQLIAEAHRDPAAFARLYRRYYDTIFRYCVHRLFDRETAKDVTSQVFLKVVENFTHFKGGEQQFRNWLYKIATNAINEYLRKCHRQKAALKIFREQSNIKNKTFEDHAVKLAILKQAVLTLKPKYQTIITLHFFENLKLTEIAEVLGSSDGTVRSQLARALAKLRKILATEKLEVIENER